MKIDFFFFLHFSSTKDNHIRSWMDFYKFSKRNLSSIGCLSWTSNQNQCKFRSQVPPISTHFKHACYLHMLDFNCPPFSRFLDDGSDSLVWKQGSFFRSKSLMIDNIKEGMITCEITLPGTSYKEVRWRKIPKLPIEFTSTSAAKPNANSINGIFVAFFLMRMLI